MPRPTQHSLQRSLTSMTLGVVQRVEKRDREQKPFMLEDRDQVFQVEVTGEVAPTLSEWNEIDCPFGYVFIGDEDNRDNPYRHPQFTFGWEMLTAEPVIIAACVTQWEEEQEGETTGATVKCAVYSPSPQAAGKQFRAIVHLTFSGYCGPIAVDEDEDPPEEIET